MDSAATLCECGHPKSEHDHFGCRHVGCPDGCNHTFTAATTEPLRAEELRDAIGDILDICEGWTRTMTDKQALDAIREVAHKAWEGERG